MTPPYPRCYDGWPDHTDESVPLPPPDPPFFVPDVPQSVVDQVQIDRFETVGVTYPGLR